MGSFVKNTSAGQNKKFNLLVGQDSKSGDHQSYYNPS